ncbi:TetR/AcrR family transcriptional regulator [Leptospira bouyouniensis]|uniref:TetR/AcrR family transcriptional regulator n=1 Tax=Leptospira bouyouniensis TaxID=2484911 RepID=A0ABY2L8Q5_9LEPT|nr:TetR/AcrR family transcriptional regulator [Leptospira bouyouniensis]TGK53039.1 TetR/AcrR family transcriptional regulator [Leptospira bouyouniensis]
MPATRNIWIVKGYEMVAIDGFDHLKIERLAKAVGKPKSSFYFLFIDLENFTKQMIEFHLNQCIQMAKKEADANSIDPELINIIIEHKIDLLFHKQIRIHRNNPSYLELIETTDSIVTIPFLNVWKKDLGIELTEIQMKGMFSLALENFYIQIHSDNLNESWLKNYFANLKTTILNLTSL